MKLIVLLICIFLQVASPKIYFHRYSFFDRYLGLIHPLLTKYKLTTGWGAISGIFLPILIIVLILNLIFSQAAILYILFGVLVLYFCLNIHELKGLLSDYFSAVASDDQPRAHTEAQKFLHEAVPLDQAVRTRAISEAIFIKSLTQVFAVIFWFLLLGPFGAILYYLVAAMSDHALRSDIPLEDTVTVASYMKDILDWLPLRLLALTFALIGHFGPVINIWVARVGSGLLDNSRFLIDCGLTALDLPLDQSQAEPKENQQVLSLIYRALWTWLIAIVVLNITSYLF